MNMERMELHIVAGDLGKLLFRAFNSKLETSDCEMFQNGKVFGIATCGSGSGTFSGRRVATGGPRMAEAPG